MKTPRNIIAIDRIKASELVGLVRTGTDSVRVSDGLSWEPVSIRVPARLSVSEKVDGGVRLYTVQLVFRICGDTGDRERWAYRCKTADGRYCLIGTDHRPWPVSVVNTVRPDNMTESQLDEVTVSYTSESRIPYIQ